MSFFSRKETSSNKRFQLQSESNCHFKYVLTLLKIFHERLIFYTKGSSPCLVKCAEYAKRQAPLPQKLIVSFQERSSVKVGNVAFGRNNVDGECFFLCRKRSSLPSWRPVLRPRSQSLPKLQRYRSPPL